MNFMKRACLYLARKKGRTAMMFLLLFFMSVSVLVGVSFKESAQKELDRLRMSMASGFVMKANTRNEMYRKYIDYGNGHGSYDYAGPMITEDMIEKILSMDGVEDYTVNMMHVVWTDLKLRPGLYAASEPDPEPDMDELIPRTEEYLELCRHTTYMYPCREGEAHKNFRTGALSITEGCNIGKGDRFKVVVSDWLAEKNRLSVGDTVTLETKEGNYGFTKEPLKTWGESVEAEVAGLFHANFSQAPSDSTLECSYIENTIYSDMDTYIKLQENLDGRAHYGNASEINDMHVTVEFLVEDPGQVDSIMSRIESRADIDLENMKLEADDTDYQAAAGSYRQIRFFATALLASGLCGTGAVLYLSLRLWAQGRTRRNA